MDIIEYLDTKKYAIKIILNIYDAQREGEHINNVRIWRSIGGSKTTIYNRVNKLQEFGLVERIVLEDHYPIMKLNRLTDRGLELARILDQIRQFSSDDE